jgi:hypothetical protein
LRTFGAASGTARFPGQDSRFEQLETRSAIHLSLDQFQPIDMSLQRSVVPGHRNRQAHFFAIAPERLSKLRKIRFNYSAADGDWTRHCADCSVGLIIVSGVDRASEV